MISVVILTKNEEHQIEACIRSVLWADEVIVIDDHSNDKTVAIAKELGAIVYDHALRENFAAQRNFGLEKTRGEWVLFLDADERISPELSREITEAISDEKNQCSGYACKRDDYLFGKRLRYGETGTRRFVRFAKRGRGKWKGRIHEVWEVSGRIKEFSAPIVHYPHQTISEFLREINFYTTVRAEELYDQNVQSNWLSILLYTKGKFLQNYFFKLGFLDGIPGIISAIMMSFHTFLVRSKLWLLQQKNRKTK